MKLTRLIMMTALLSGSIWASAQENSWCGAMNVIQDEMRDNPELQQQYREMIESMKQEAKNPASRATEDVIFIPVVFHIVHNGDAIGTGENIPDAQVYSQIDILNQCFNKMDAANAGVPDVFKGLVANCNIQFCLAKFDPSGNPTNGIIRHEINRESWDSTSTINRTLKPATQWDRQRYLNVWSVRMGGQLLDLGYLAYASFPGVGQASSDGVVCRFNLIGASSSGVVGHNKGKTLAHEVGHWLGLFHIWGDDDGKCSGDIGGGSDFISDTPDQAGLNFGCPVFPKVSCNNGPNGDMFMNYMDYVNDECMAMFTLGQSARMQNVLNTSRATIKTAASKCYYSLDASIVDFAFPKDTVCSLTFQPKITLKNEGLTTLTSGKIYYQVDGGNVQSINWSGSLAMQQQTQVALPEVTLFEGDHSLYATFSNANGQASDNLITNDSKDIVFYVYDGGPAASLPVSEGFEADYPPVGWTIVNPNNDITWEPAPAYGAYDQSSTGIAINNLWYSSNPNKRKDAFITDVYDFKGVEYPELSFDVSYARYSASRFDSLNVYYSLNCGSSWNRVWSQTNTDLATAPDQTVEFKTSGSFWKGVQMHLPDLKGQRKVSFKFENVTGWGNVLYLDNINLRNNPALDIQELKRVAVQVFPNPASGLAAVRLPLDHSFLQISLVNMLGETVYSSRITDSAVLLPLDNLSSGLYLIHLTGENLSQSERLMVGK